MATITLEIESLRDFVSQTVASPDSPAVDLERFKAEVEDYLRDLRAAVTADLQSIRDNCCPTGASP